MGWGWWILFLVVCMIGAWIGEAISTAQDSFAVAVVVLGCYVAGGVWLLSWAAT